MIEDAEKSHGVGRPGVMGGCVEEIFLTAMESTNSRPDLCVTHLEAFQSI